MQDNEKSGKTIKVTLEPSPIHEFIGFKISEVGEGYCEIRVPIRNQILNGHGAVHGGIYYATCDIAAYSALSTILEESSFSVTSDINVSLVSAANDGEMIVKAKVLKLGKRLAVMEANVFDDKEKLLAVARITKTILRRP